MAKPMICACVFLLLLRVGQSSLLQNGVIIGAKSVFGKCEGLNIASMAKTENYDVMRDGSTSTLGMAFLKLTWPLPMSMTGSFT